MSSLSPARLRATLAELAARPRGAGTEAGRAAAGKLAASWEGAGLDAGLWTFRSRVPRLASARLTLHAPGDAARDITPGEDPLAGIWPAEAGPVPPPFISGSGEASLEAEAVYAFMGRPEDFDLLAAHDIDLRDRIVLVRAAGVAAARPALERAAARGALAVLLAPDLPSGRDEAAYPAGPGRAADAVTRGALPSPPRAEGGGRLPVHPVGEREAQAVLASLAGVEAPASWRGEGTAGKHLGPGPGRVALELRLDSSPLEAVNVLARLEGAVWPDQIVVLGAARDAWALDAAENGTSVAALSEIALGLSRLVAKGWRPRRTILLAAWDASLAGGLGAAAWLEDGPLPLVGGAVAYLDAGRGLSGPRLEVIASPELRHLAESVAGVAGPLDSALLPDAAAFAARGIPVVEIARPGGAGSAASTAHDTLDRLERFADAGLAQAAGAARLWATLALRLADAPLPPLAHAAAAGEALAAVAPLLEDAHRAFAENPPPLNNLRLALLRLRRTAEAWDEAARRELAAHAGPSGAGRSAARGDVPDPMDRRGRAGAASLSARLALSGQPLADYGGCTSLLSCPDPTGGPAVPLPGLRAALVRGDRDDFVAQTLILVSAAQTATLRLEEALLILQQGAVSRDRTH